jgi:hypothetical protein
MGASSIVLLAKGPQDVQLTGTPSFSFFRYAYKQHTNFSTDSVEMVADGDTTWGGSFRVILKPFGDLITDAYVAVQLPAVTVTGPVQKVNWIDNLGYAMLERVELWIGGLLIERQSGEWMEIWSQLTLTGDKQNALSNMIGYKSSLTFPAASIAPQLIYIPLSLFFCRHLGCALPILAIQGQVVELRFKFRPAASLVHTYHPDNVVNVGPLENVSVFVSYVYLGDAERKTFIQKPLTYLAEVVIDNGTNVIGGATGTSVELVFYNPVKEVIFVVQRANASSTTFALNADNIPDYNNWFDYSSTATQGEQLNMVSNILFQINGQDVITAREAQYYNQYVPWRVHTHAPDVGIFCYSFALKPEDIQPSGTANFSRFDSAILRVQFNEVAKYPCYLRAYALTYNCLEVKNGQAALVYMQ